MASNLTPKQAFALACRYLRMKREVDHWKHHAHMADVDFDSEEDWEYSMRGLERATRLEAEMALIRPQLRPHAYIVWQAARCLRWTPRFSWHVYSEVQRHSRLWRMAQTSQLIRIADVRSIFGPARPFDGTGLMHREQFSIHAYRWGPTWDGDSTYARRKALFIQAARREFWSKRFPESPSLRMVSPITGREPGEVKRVVKAVG